MAHQTHLKAAVATFVAAVAFAACAWHFAWREAAYWSTGEQITAEELRRAHVLSGVFGWSAAIVGASAVVLTWLFVRARRRAAS